MTKWVRFFLIANVVIYFAQMTMAGFTETFALVPALALYRPWTVVTYMFLHDPTGFSHIIFNMIGLWIAGTRVEGIDAIARRGPLSVELRRVRGG